MMLKQHYKYKDKKSIFNLSESDNIQLTHNGKLLSDVHVDYDGGFGEDDDDTNPMENFGGGDDGWMKVNHESKLAEVIANRKEEERQKFLNKEKNEDLYTKLQNERKNIFIPRMNENEKKKEEDIYKSMYQERFTVLLKNFKEPSRVTGRTQLSKQQQAVEDAKKLKKQEEERIRRTEGPKKKLKKKIFNVDSLSYKMSSSIDLEGEDQVLSFPMQAGDESKYKSEYDAEVDGDDFQFSSDGEEDEDEEGSAEDHGIGFTDESSEQNVSEEQDYSEDEDEEDNYSDISDSGNEDENGEESVSVSASKENYSDISDS